MKGYWQEFERQHNDVCISVVHKRISPWETRFFMGNDNSEKILKLDNGNASLFALVSNSWVIVFGISRLHNLHAYREWSVE